MFQAFFQQWPPKRLTHASCVVGTLILVVGCAKPPAPVSLVGLSAADVTARLGKPDSTVVGVMAERRPDFGPTAEKQLPGEAYQFYFYKDHGGRQFHIWMAAPEIYQRIHGSAPGPEPYYVVEVAEYPAGVVF